MPLTLGLASPTYSGHIPSAGSDTDHVLWLLDRCADYGLQSLQWAQPLPVPARPTAPPAVQVFTRPTASRPQQLAGSKQPLSVRSRPIAEGAAVRRRWGGLPLSEPELIGERSRAAGVQLVPFWNHIDLVGQVFS